jgi:hypothetical protein
MIKGAGLNMRVSKYFCKSFSMKRSFIAIISLVMVFMVTPDLLAAKSKKDNQKPRKPASSEYEIRVETQYGDREGIFVIQRSGEKATLRFSNNIGQVVKKDLTLENADALAGLYLELPVNDYVPAECYRNKVTIVSKGVGAEKVSKNSCFGLRTKTSEAYERFLQILTLAM